VPKLRLWIHQIDFKAIIIQGTINRSSKKDFIDTVFGENSGGGVWVVKFGNINIFGLYSEK